MPIVYDVIVTSSTIPFSTIQCCEISIFCLISYQRPPKSQELLFNHIFKPCKNYKTFLETDSELSTTEFRRKRIKLASFCRSVFSEYLVICSF